jgi:hypothetical protein
MQASLIDIEHNRAVWDERCRGLGREPAPGRGRRRTAVLLARAAARIDREAARTTLLPGPVPERRP